VVDRNVLAVRLGELSARIARVRTHCPPEASALENDQDTLDLVVRGAGQDP
jgi:hypothetical protein